MTFTTPIPFLDALEKLRRKEVLPSSFDTDLWRRVAVGVRERAFFSARVESARVLGTMQDYLDDYLANARMENGGLVAQGRAEFVAQMRELAIREGLGKVDPETGEIDPNIRESDLEDIRSISRLELIFDTQTEAANEYGYWREGQDPDILDVWPAQRFIRVRPVAAPRPYHEAALGTVRRKDDLKFWLSMNRDFGVPWGPWGFNSGCGVEDVDREEAEELGVIQKNEAVKPVEKEFNEGLAAGILSMDERMLAALVRSTGGTVAGGALRVAPQAKFNQALFSDPEGEGTIEIEDEMVEDLRRIETAKQWGEAKAFASISAARRSELLEDEAKRLAKASVEESALVDSEGEYHARTGNQRFVSWPEELLPGAVMTHTHTEGGTLGPEDIDLLLIHGMAGIRAVGGGRVYSATIGANAARLGKGETLTEDTEEGRQARREATAVMMRMLGNRGTKLERDQLLTRLTWARLHQRGVIRYEEETL